MKAAGVAALLTLVACLAGVVIVEIAMRALNPRPPTQVVRLLDQPPRFRPSLRHGVPVWKASADREHTRCAEEFPERTRILVFGDSVTYGISLAAPEVFTALLEDGLNAGRGPSGVCVMNFAQPGFGFEQSFAVARDEILRWKPALVLWESFGDDREYIFLHGTAYLVNAPYLGAFARLAVRPDGSIGLTGMPAGLNAWLFAYSRLYEMLVLRWGQVEPATTIAAGDPPGVERYRRLRALVDAAGAKLVVYFATPLDRPFAELAADPRELQRGVLEFARQHDVPTYVLPRELIDEDHLALRLDPWCHFNAVGHRVLAERFRNIVLRELVMRAEPRASP